MAPKFSCGHGHIIGVSSDYESGGVLEWLIWDGRCLRIERHGTTVEELHGDEALRVLDGRRSYFELFDFCPRCGSLMNRSKIRMVFR